MSQIRSIPLHRTLPLVFIGLFLIGALLLTTLEYWQSSSSLKTHEQQELRSQLNLLALPVRRALESQRVDELNALIGSLATHPANDVIAITDDRGGILVSSRYAWRGKPIGELLPEADDLISTQNGTTRLVDVAHGYLAVNSVDYYTGGKGIREHHRALIWIRDNLRREQRLILYHALRHASWLLGLGLLGTFTLMYLGRRYIATPLDELARYAARLADGDYTAKPNIAGKGEIADLAAHLQHQGQRIASTLEALKESEEGLSVTLDSIGDAVIVTDTKARVTRMNPAAEELTGWPLEEARGKPLLEVFNIINASTRKPAVDPVQRVLREGIVVGLANHTALISRSGAEYQIADSAAPIRTPDGEMLGVIMVFQDVTAAYATQQHLRETHARLDALTQALPDVCLLLSSEGEYLEIFGGDPRLLSRARDELLGRHVSEILPELNDELMRVIADTLRSGEQQDFEYALDLPIGRRYFEGRTAPMQDGGQPAVVWLARDVTRRKVAEAGMRRLAHYDPLTGLPNRHMLEKQLKQAISRSKRSGGFGALIFIDLDDFKQINDSMGHQHGDKVLTLLAERLKSVLREEDMIFRFGGDEFLVLLEQLDDEVVQASEFAEGIAEKLRAACTRPVELEGQPLHLSLSIGITLFPDADTSLDNLVRRADIAMYRAKETGRGRICFFSAGLQRIAEDRMRVQHELREALERDELKLFIQPLVGASGAWLGGEVLLRWRHPDRGLVPPDAFVPIAEKSGLINTLDQWVIANSIQRFAGEAEKPLPEAFTGLSINLSCPMLMKANFTAQLRDWLRDSRLDGSRLEFEITERLLVEDYAQTAKVMKKAREFGVRFSIDDFGTGCSTLRYLQRLPLDRIKIDRSFIKHLPARHNDAILVETIIDMAGHLGLETVAEGVEDETQQRFLAARGCNYFQGYLFAAPMPWEEFFRRLRAERNGETP